jgi:ribosomal protein L16 Arg81 hydroxylase
MIMPVDYHHPVNTIQEVESSEFRENYLKKNMPVVVKGLLPKFKAYEKWTIDNLKSIAGNIDVGVFNGSAAMDRSVKQAHSKMKFSDYLDLISRDEPVDARLFLFDIFKRRPELKNDFYYPDIPVIFLKKFPFMFFGGKGSVVRMHQDMDYSNVFLMQFHGRKRVILFSPKYSDLLYRFPFNVHTEVDITRPDYHRFPALQYVKGYETVLNPGDMLFMPSGYWHHITYLDGGFAMSIRSLSHQWSNVLHGLLNVTVRSPFDDMMRHIMGPSWFAYKQQAAQGRANAAMHKYQSQHWNGIDFTGTV